MDHNEFFNQLKSGEISNVYLFCGQEHFILSSALDKLEKALVDESLRELNCAILEAPSADDVVCACQTVPFCADKRLVIVKDFASLLPVGTSEGESSLIEYLKNPSQTCVLVFICAQPDRRRAFFKALAKHNVVEFNQLTPTDTARWATQYLKRAGKAISPQDAAFLCQYTSSSPSFLVPELEKLISYQTGPTITQKDILEIVTPEVDFNVFKMIDFIWAKNKEAACAILSTMLCQREDPLRILGAISHNCAQMLAVKELLEKKVSKQEAIKILGVRDFVYSRLASACAKKSVAQLSCALDKCFECDFGLKQRLQFPHAALHKLVIELCEI